MEEKEDVVVVVAVVDEKGEEEKEEKAVENVSGTREGGGIRARGYSWTPQNTVLAATSAVA